MTFIFRLPWNCDQLALYCDQMHRNVLFGLSWEPLSPPRAWERRINLHRSTHERINLHILTLLSRFDLNFSDCLETATSWECTPSKYTQICYFDRICDFYSNGTTLCRFPLEHRLIWNAGYMNHTKWADYELLSCQSRTHIHSTVHSLKFSFPTAST